MDDPDEISLVPPQIVADNAAKGLAMRAKFKRGGTEIGVARATELKARKPLAPSTIRRMVSYFARHEVDKRGKNYGNEANPSAGYIAWHLWGGDEGRGGKSLRRLHRLASVGRRRRPRLGAGAKTAHRQRARHMKRIRNRSAQPAGPPRAAFPPAVPAR
jgi:hypothetical protein